MNENEKNLQEAMIKYGIPEYMLDGFILYILQGVPPGGFLTAVLYNDLIDSYSKADSTNIDAIPNYVRFLYNHAPASCFGSPEKVSDWIKHNGLEYNYPLTTKERKNE